MFRLKLFFYLVILSSTLHFVLMRVLFDEKDPEFQRSRFKSMKCISENTSIIKFTYCRVKVTRNSSGLAINMTFHPRLQRPLNLRLTTHYKYGQIYRQIFQVPEFELCRALKNFNQLPPFIRAVFDVFGETIAQVLKGCPFINKMDLLVLADVTKFPSIFPSGMYRSDVYISTTNKTKLVHFAVEIEMVTSIRTSF